MSNTYANPLKPAPTGLAEIPASSLVDDVSLSKSPGTNLKKSEASEGDSTVPLPNAGTLRFRCCCPLSISLRTQVELSQIAELCRY